MENRQIFSRSWKCNQIRITNNNIESKRNTHLFKSPSRLANRTIQSSDSPIIRMAPQMAYTFDVPVMEPVFGSTSTMLICTEAWSLAWMIRLLAELHKHININIRFEVMYFGSEWKKWIFRDYENGEQKWIWIKTSQEFLLLLPLGGHILIGASTHTHVDEHFIVHSPFTGQVQVNELSGVVFHFNLLKAKKLERMKSIVGGA